MDGDFICMKVFEMVTAEDLIAMNEWMVVRIIKAIANRG